MHTEFSSNEQNHWRAFLEQLREYVRLELEGQQADQIYPHVAYYIESVPQCEAAYDEEFRRQGTLKTTMELRAVGRETDLDSLLEDLRTHSAGPSENNPRHRWLERAFSGGRAWIEQSTDRWRRLDFNIPALELDTESPQLLPGFMSADSVSSADKTVRLDLPEDATVEIKLAIKSASPGDGEGLHILEIAVTPQEHFGDFSGIEVTLLLGNTISQQATDIFGKVVFHNLPPDRLTDMRLIVSIP